MFLDTVATKESFKNMSLKGKFKRILDELLNKENIQAEHFFEKKAPYWKTTRGFSSI